MTQPAASGPDQFDPAAFTVVEPRTFEDLKVGDIFRAPSRTLTDAHATAFQAVSADNHPIHYNVDYARGHGHVAPVVHGLQVLAFTAPGATLFPQYIGDVFIAFTSVSCTFLAEAHAGDTLYPQLQITALAPHGGAGQVTTGQPSATSTASWSSTARTPTCSRQRRRARHELHTATVRQSTIRAASPSSAPPWTAGLPSSIPLRCRARSPTRNSSDRLREPVRRRWRL
jgi:acyl dehydratase